jgi:hypothetical protein
MILGLKCRIYCKFPESRLQENYSISQGFLKLGNTIKLLTEESKEPI